MHPWILRLLSFFAAASTACAGLAVASPSRSLPGQAAPGPAPAAPRADRTPTPDRGPEPAPGHDDGEDPAAPPTPGDWAATVATRLAALRPASPPADPDARGDAHLEAKVRDALAGLDATVSVHARELDTGRVLVDLQGQRNLNPASNQKILTGLAALELLGADYRFETRLVVAGDTLFVIGEGDPTLMLEDVHAMTAQLVASGRARGLRRLVVDDSAFTERQLGPGYAQGGAGASYLAPSGALSVNFNTVEAVVHPVPGGAALELLPPSTMARGEVEVRSGRGALELRSDDDRGITVVQATGKISAAHAPVRERRRVADPGLFAGGVFAAALATQTGAAPLPVARGAAPKVESVVVRRSAPLGECLASAMKYSNNFTTEQVLRTLAWRASGQPGSWDAGVEIVDAYWRAVGHDPEAFDFANGSGLHREGRATARALVDLVSRAAALEGDAAALETIMARSGGEGTLHYRLGALRDRVRAKTGTLAGVSALSGTVVSREGDRKIAFSILVRGADAQEARARQDRIVYALAGHLDRHAPRVARRGAAANSTANSAASPVASPAPSPQG